MESTGQRTLIEKSIAIALEAHDGQKDRYGNPYILHALTVGLGGSSEAEIVAGILHDVVEDSDYTLQDLAKRGISESIIVCVDALTKRDGEKYDEYINRVLENHVAARIKLRDLEHNLALSRLQALHGSDLQRINRYLEAWRRIQKKLDEAKT